MSQINYSKIKDRYGNALKEPDKKPTLEQAAFAWAVVNELKELGYVHDFYTGDPWVVRYCYDESAILDKARRVIELNQKGIDDGETNKI